MKLIRRATAVPIAICALLWIVAMTTPVFAAGDTPITTDSNSLARITLSAVVVQLLVSVFIPIITGIVTTSSARIKGLVTIILNAVTALIVTATTADGTAVISEQTLLTAAIGVASSLLAYVHAWKPLGLTNSNVIVATPDGDALVTKPGVLANVGAKG
jgi:hypothetical protein